MVRSKILHLVRLNIDEEEAGRAAWQGVIDFPRHGAVDQDHGGEQK